MQESLFEPKFSLALENNTKSFWTISKLLHDFFEVAIKLISVIEFAYIKIV